MKLTSLSIFAVAVALLESGCSETKPAVPTTKPNPSEGTTRPKPDENGKMEKATGEAPKGAMKPVAD